MVISIYFYLVVCTTSFIPNQDAQPGKIVIMIQLVFVKISSENHENLMRNHISEFPIHFQNKLLKFKRWQDAQSSLLGRLLLRYVLLNEGVDLHNEILHYSSNGKPYLINQDLKFNISHSGDLVVCAVGENLKIGIDIEIIKDLNIEDFKDQMLESEWGRVSSSNNPLVEFYTYWTQKEAVLKACGEGLSIPLKSFEVSKKTSKLYKETYYLREINIDENYLCSLASDKKIPTHKLEIKNLKIEDL